MTHIPIHVYESPTAKPEHRFCAMYQFETHLFGFQHDATAEGAVARLTAVRERIFKRYGKTIGAVAGTAAVGSADSPAVASVAQDLEDLF